MYLKYFTLNIICLPRLSLKLEPSPFIMSCLLASLSLYFIPAWCAILIFTHAQHLSSHLDTHPRSESESETIRILSMEMRTQFVGV